MVCRLNVSFSDGELFGFGGKEPVSCFKKEKRFIANPVAAKLASDMGLPYLNIVLAG